MAKFDNTKQTIYDLKGVFLQEDEYGEAMLTHDDFDDSIRLVDILKDFMGKEIDFKIGGAIKISSELFDREDE